MITLCVINAGAELVRNEDLVPAAALVPGAAPVLEARSLAPADTTGTSKLHSALTASLAREPLDAEALAALGALAEREGGARAAFPLMTRAVETDPRSRRARAWLMQYYLVTGRYPEAAAQLDRLIVLMPEERRELLVGLAILANVPSTAPMVRRMLARSPGWIPNFFDAMNEQGVPPARAAAFVDFADDRSKQVFVQMLFRQGDVDAARRYRGLWLGPNGGLIADERLHNIRGAGPFAWVLTPVGSEQAEFQSGGGLVVNRDTADAANYANQTTLLLPGEYRIEVKARAEGSARQDALTVAVRCGTQAPLVRVEVPTTDNDSGAARNFRVPAKDCGVQTLSLDGPARDSSAPVAVTVDMVGLRPTSSD